LQLWLARGGCGVAAAARALKLLRRLVAGGAPAGCVTFWEWAVAWPWVAHALEASGLDWRAALRGQPQG
jgi:hypothetical protein